MTAAATGRNEASTAPREAQVEDFLSAIRLIKRRLSTALPEDLRAEVGDVTVYQLEALFCLIASDGGITMNELARAQGVGLSSCTALVDRLVRHELAERAADPNDRRVVRVLATGRARDAVQRFHTARAARVAEMLAGLDAAEVAELNRLLHSMAAGGDQVGSA